MARGPKKHLKRINTPNSWLLSKMGGVYATRPSQGPHKLRECLPLAVILKYFLCHLETTSDSASQAEKPTSLFKTEKLASKLIIKSEDPSSSQSALWTPSPSLRPTKTTDFFMTLKVDSTSSKLKILKLKPNC